MSPRTLQESSNPSFQDKRLHSNSTIDQHLEKVDFDPESQTKHYWANLFDCDIFVLHEVALNKSFIINQFARYGISLPFQKMKYIDY